MEEKIGKIVFGPNKENGEIMLSLDAKNPSHIFGCVLCIAVWLTVGFLIGRWYAKR